MIYRVDVSLFLPVINTTRSTINNFKLNNVRPECKISAIEKITEIICYCSNVFSMKIIKLETSYDTYNCS